jgi:hypothetical protein
MLCHLPNEDEDFLSGSCYLDKAFSPLDKIEIAWI